MYLYIHIHIYTRKFCTNKYLCLCLYAAEMEKLVKGTINYEDILLTYDVKSNHSGTGILFI